MDQSQKTGKRIGSAMGFNAENRRGILGGRDQAVGKETNITVKRVECKWLLA
jgi:hypothetical protein